MTNAALHIGLVINPLAGLGGALAMKGSDGEQARELATDGDHTRPQERAQRALSVLADAGANLAITCWAGDMGERAVRAAGLGCQVLGAAQPGLPNANDTRLAVAALQAAGVDLVVFVGGDGTARDVYDVLGDSFPALGIPAGVKMQSGVFAVSPEAAGELLLRLARGGLVDVHPREVRDIDEEALREGRVNSRFYGDLLAPAEGHYLQHTKIGGREDPELAAADIAEWLAENVEEGVTYLLGPGTTVAAYAAALGVDNTLLGVDVVRDGERLVADADEAALLSAVHAAPGGIELIITPTGGQGYLLGRGNQQISAPVMRRVGRDSLRIIACKSKISQLQGRPLLLDLDDPALNLELVGYYQVTTGYDDRILYRVSNGLDSD